MNGLGYGNIAAAAATEALLAVTFLFLLQLDTIVNVTLYDYNLQFSLAWANIYWLYLKLIMGAIAGAAIIVPAVAYHKTQHCEPTQKTTNSKPKQPQKDPEKEELKQKLTELSDQFETFKIAQQLAPEEKK